MSINLCGSCAQVDLEQRVHSFRFVKKTEPKRKKQPLGLLLIVFHVLKKRIGAGEEDRTLDIDLGKVALYR